MPKKNSKKDVQSVGFIRKRMKKREKYRLIGSNCSSNIIPKKKKKRRVWELIEGGVCAQLGKLLADDDGEVS